MLFLLLVKSSYPSRVLEFAAIDFAQLRGRGDRTVYLEVFGGYANNRGYSARANEELAAYIASHTGPDDVIYQFGINGAGVDFATDRLSAHPFMRVNMFVGIRPRRPRLPAAGGYRGDRAPAAALSHL